MTSFFFLKIQVQSIYEQFRAFLHSVEIISFTKKLKKFFLPSEKAIHLGKSAFHLTTVDRWLCCQWPTAFASAAREKKAANMRYSGCGCFRPPYPWRLQLNDQLPLSTIFFSLSFRLLFGSKNSRTLRFSFHFPYPSGRIDRPWRPPLQIFRTGRWISWMRLFRPKWTAFPRIFLWFLFGLNRNAFDDKVGRGLRPTFHSTQCHLRRLCVWRLIWKIENFSTKWPG